MKNPLGRLVGRERETSSATRFAGEESDTTESLRRAWKPAKNVTEAARAGQAWEDEDRRRFSR